MRVIAGQTFRRVVGRNDAIQWRGAVKAPATQITPPPTIQINSLTPSSGAHGTSVSVAVSGIDLQPGDTIVWDGGAVATNYIYAGQVTTDNVQLGATPRAVLVHLARGAEVSNELTFTVT